MAYPKQKNPSFEHLELLQTELESRQSHNPRYSFRALARLFAMRPAALRRGMAARQELTYEKYLTMLSKVKLTEDERGAFIDSVVKQKVSLMLEFLKSAASKRP